MKIKSYIISIPIIVCSVLALTFSGCGKSAATLNNADHSISSGSDTSTATGSSTITAYVTLTWEAPATYTDGTSLSSSDITGYRVYYTVWPGAYNTIKSLFVSAPATSTTINVSLQDAAGICYFVVTTVDISGIESEYSNEVSKAI